MHLTVGLADGLRRTGMSTARPLLAGVNPRATFKALLDARAPLYREVATVEVDTVRRSANQVARAVLEAIGRWRRTRADPEDPADPTTRSTSRPRTTPPRCRTPPSGAADGGRIAGSQGGPAPERQGLGRRMTETVRIDVAAERPYPVLVGRGVRDRLTGTVTGLGAAAAVIVHQPPWPSVAERVRGELIGAGVDAHRVEVPDAEEGKSLAVAGFCWEVCGRRA